MTQMTLPMGREPEEVRVRRLEPRERWAAYMGRMKILVPGRTKEEALKNARSRGIEPDVVVRAGGSRLYHDEDDRQALAADGW